MVNYHEVVEQGPLIFVLGVRVEDLLVRENPWIDGHEPLMEGTAGDDHDTVRRLGTQQRRHGQVKRHSRHSLRKWMNENPINRKYMFSTFEYINRYMKKRNAH